MHEMGMEVCVRINVGLVNARSPKVWGKYREKLILQDDLAFLSKETVWWLGLVEQSGVF